MIRTKYVTIESSGKINELGGIIGPITTPTQLDINVIIALINSGKAVYEVNPANIKDKTRLNRMNVLKTIYRPAENKSRMPMIKAADVGLANTTTEPSVVKTTIVQEIDDDTIGTDIFISNKYS